MVNMKETSQRTKVVIRKLPPLLSQSHLISQIDSRFSLRYNCFYFRPGNPCQKRQRHARAYINFKNSDDVFEFAKFFDGHMFVNEKGAQFKAIVEYAPSQRVPMPCARKDSREGTIYTDPDYLEFLKVIAKPVENVPSAEIQLEIKEANQSGAAKETPVVTPLMEFVRQKRAAEVGAQGALAVWKIRKRFGSESKGKLGMDTKRGSKTKKDSAKNTMEKDKPTFVEVKRRDTRPATSHGKEISEKKISADSGKKKIRLLKRKENTISNVPEEQQCGISPVENTLASTVTRQSESREASGRLIRRIPLNNERQSASSTTIQLEQKSQTLNLKNGKQLPWPMNGKSGFDGRVLNNEPPSSNTDSKRAPDVKFMKKYLHGLVAVSDKWEKPRRNKDRPDCGVGTMLCHSESSVAIEERLSFSESQPTQLHSESAKATYGEKKNRTSYKSQNMEACSPSGSHRSRGQRRVASVMKNDSSRIISEGKSSKRGGATGAGAYEKQVWVRRSTSGS